ncbi:hypothetical protein ACMD2_13209, partial [Ananas comosus]
MASLSFIELDAVGIWLDAMATSNNREYPSRPSDEELDLQNMIMYAQVSYFPEEDEERSTSSQSYSCQRIQRAVVG